MGFSDSRGSETDGWRGVRRRLGDGWARFVLRRL